MQQTADGHFLCLSVETITLNDSTELPYLAFGTGTALYQQSCVAQVKQAIESGFVHIDTAESTSSYLQSALARYRSLPCTG